MESEERRPRRLMDAIWACFEFDQNGGLRDEFLWAGFGGFEFEGAKVVAASILAFATVRF